MTNAGHALATDDRSEPREAVFYRTRLSGTDGAECPTTLVNVSAGGFMARCDHAYAAGDELTVVLPRLGRIAAQVRWSLGGRIGCQLARPLGMSDYHLLLQALPRA